MAASKILDGIFICNDSQSEKQRKTVFFPKTEYLFACNHSAPT